MKKKKNALIFCSSEKFRDIELYLINHIKNKKNLYSVFVVNQLVDKIYYLKKYPNLIDEIIVAPNEINLLKEKFSKDHVKKKILQFEKKYNTTINRMFLSDRIHGRGWHASGGLYHPKSLLTNTSYSQLLYFAYVRINFWENQFKKFKVKLAINLAPELAELAIKNSVKICNLNISKYGKALYWSLRPNHEPSQLLTEFKKHKTKVYKKINILKPHHNYAVVKKILDRDFMFFITAYKSFRVFPLYLYARIRKYKKGMNTLPLSNFKYIWRKRFDFLYLKKIANINPVILKEKKIKFIYFPLLTEPEVVLHRIAKDFFFQLTAIQMIARDLPADVKLVVKEHIPALGRRPRDFYHQILELKNVYIADPSDNGIEYIKLSKGVSLITGTAGWEAAAMGIPVITFSKYNAFNFLDHVFYVRDSDDTLIILNKILNKCYPNKKSEEDGARLYHSYKKISVEAKNRIPYTYGSSVKLIDKKLIVKLYNNLNKLKVL